MLESTVIFISIWGASLNIWLNTKGSVLSSPYVLLNPIDVNTSNTCAYRPDHILGFFLISLLGIIIKT